MLLLMFCLLFLSTYAGSLYKIQDIIVSVFKENMKDIIH